MPGTRLTLRRAIRWWRAPWWFAALFTGAKSFVDNQILGSPALNRLGLHVWRVRAAHTFARFRRSRLKHLLTPEQRREFDRDGFVVVRDVLPSLEFNALKSALFASEFDSRAQQQGDAVTRRVAVGSSVLRRFPQLAELLDAPPWKGLMAYVASTSSEPLYYIQTIFGGVASGEPDPQLQLHADTFHPSLKAWFFFTDVEEADRPLIYVAGSHRLSPARLEWEKRKSETVLEAGDRLSQRGSFRIEPKELPELGLPEPTRFCVPANTLVVADTCGFHARGDSDRPTIRVELWAYSRRAPFLPWTGLDPLSWRPIARRRVEWLNTLLDWCERRGIARQHWRPVGSRRLLELSKAGSEP